LNQEKRDLKNTTPYVDEAFWNSVKNVQYNFKSTDMNPSHFTKDSDDGCGSGAEPVLFLRLYYYCTHLEAS
jgi:hypothetical protein